MAQFKHCRSTCVDKVPMIHTIYFVIGQYKTFQKIINYNSASLSTTKSKYKECGTTAKIL